MDFNDLISIIKKIVGFPLFTVKQTPITLTSLMIFIFFMGIIGLTARLARRIMTRWLMRFSSLEEGTRFVLIRITQYLIFIIGALISFQFIGLDLSGLAVIFGLLSVGVGFGLQNIVANFIAGLVLLFERPIRVGDRVTVGGTEGDIEEINLRSTTVRTLENVSIIVPNSEFTSTQIINWSYGDTRIRIAIDVGVSYQSDLQNVIDCLLETAAEHPKVLKTPQPEVQHRGFGDSAWEMKLWAWIKNPKEHQTIRSDLRCAIVEKFRIRHIEIPFPQRDLHIYPEQINQKMN